MNDALNTIIHSVEVRTPETNLICMDYIRDIQATTRCKQD